MRFAIFLQFFIFVCSSSGIFGLLNDVLGGGRNLIGNNGLSPTFEGRIVNGTKANPGQFPHQVSLRRSYSNNHFCGGSIISDEWILTAGHCMFARNGVRIAPWTISVVAGQIKLYPNHPRSETRAVQAIILHPNFDKATLANDVALLKLTMPLSVDTAYVKVAKLQNILPEPRTVCEVSGWGYLFEEGRTVSNDLLYVPLPIVDFERCQDLLVNVTDLWPGMFCAGWENGLRDACQGDSGGGMICGNVLTGVVSGGEGCARPRMPGVYSDVAYYRDWILDELENFNSTSDYVPQGKMNPDDSGNGAFNLHSQLSFNFLLVAYTLLSFFRCSALSSIID